MGKMLARLMLYLCIEIEKLMTDSIIITPRVVETIKALPVKEREAISYALIDDLILGIDPKESLTPMEGILYTMIKYYVTHDTHQREMRLSKAE